jgi:uncharacterized protein
MRLSASEVTAINAAATKIFGADAVVRLFGSRLHDDLRGGDIDLHIEVDEKIPDFRQQSKFLEEIERATDGRKVDIAFSLRNHAPFGFDRIPYAEGKIL